MIRQRILLALYLVVFMSVLAWSPQVADAGEDAVKDGDKVKMEYTGTLKDGTVFDSSERHDKPLEFTVGSGQVIPGFDKAVMGMKIGEEKEFTVSSAEAYGSPNPKMIRRIPKKNLPKDSKPKVGMMLMVTDPSGRKRPAKITAVDAESITVDMNHPLAGKALTFKIKLKEISH